MADRQYQKREDARSDIEQAVEARSDAVDRGEGGSGKSVLDDGGTGGTGDTHNQDVSPGAPTGG